MLNGRKRWIGNATFADIIVIWARSSETKQARSSHTSHVLARCPPACWNLIPPNSSHYDFPDLQAPGHA